MIFTMTAVGLYQRNFREGLGGMLLRVALSAVLSLIIMTVLFYLFPSVFLGRGAFGIAFYCRGERGGGAGGVLPAGGSGYPQTPDPGAGRGQAGRAYFDVAP